MRFRIYGGAIAAVAFLFVSSTWANAQQATTNCRNSGNFDKWLADFRREALEKGLSPRTYMRAQHLLTLDHKIIGIDRGQRVFSQPFLEFSNRMAGGGRTPRAQELIKKHAAIFQKVEEQYGVPAPVITAYWALESGFGADVGKYEVLRSLATLAYDCRRSERFRKELHSALKIIERGDLTPETMVGSWAGELGQTQFLPSHYFDYGVDFDGSGKVDLLRSVPDVLATTAHYIQKIGWRRGEPWMLEVRVPQPRAMVEVGCHARKRQAAAGRRAECFALVANGAAGTCVSRLSELPHLHGMESLADLFDDRSLFGYAHCGCAAAAQGQRHAG
jgi:lytic murein transglycosylase